MCDQRTSEAPKRASKEEKVQPLLNDKYRYTFITRGINTDLPRILLGQVTAVLAGAGDRGIGYHTLL